MRTRALRTATWLYAAAIRRRRRHFPPGADEQAAIVFDGLQRDAFRAGGWPRLIACWCAEAWSLARAGRRAASPHGPAGDSSPGKWRLHWGHDLRDGFRSIRGTPGYTAFVLAILALGIGANTAVFSVLDALLFKPLPFAEPDRLVLAAEWPRTGGNWTTAPTAFAHWRASARTFEQLEARLPVSFSVLDGGDPESVRGARVTPGFFTMLGVAAAHGRTFTPDDASPAQPCVAVISHRLWTSRYGGSRRAIGQLMRLSGRQCTLIGVLPAGTTFDRGAPELYVPLVFTPQEAQSEGRMLTVLGRLATGVSIEQTRVELESVAAAFNATRGRAGENWTTLTIPWRESLVGAGARRLTWTLFAAVGLVLVIACANIASLALSRAIARRREIAVRAALGATRARVFRTLLFEHLILAVAGGAIGIAVGSALLRAFVALVPAGTLPAEIAPTLDLRVLAFTLVVSLMVGLLAGTLPAWQAGRSSLTEVIGGGSRGASGTRRTTRMQSALLVVELAIAMVLVTGAALLTVTFARVASVPPGFDPAQVLTFRLSTPAGRYPADGVADLFDRITNAINQIPGVERAGAVTSLPLGGWLFGTRFRVDGVPEDRDRPPSAHIQTATPGYIEALRIQLAAGRTFTIADRASAPRVAMVNETFARRFIPDNPAVGRRLYIGSTPGDADRPWEIVGVLRDVKTGGLTDPALATPEIYVPHAQSPESTMYFAVRTANGDPMAVVTSVRAAVRRLDDELPVSDAMSMEARVGASLRARRFRTATIALFSVLAALLACTGVYAVRARAVAARRRELGIRVALGATQGRVMALALGQGVRLTILGLAIGVAAAVPAGRYVESWLFETAPSDPAVLAASALLLGGASVLASWVPAVRVAAQDPVAALREP